MFYYFEEGEMSDQDENKFNDWFDEFISHFEEGEMNELWQHPEN